MASVIANQLQRKLPFLSINLKLWMCSKIRVGKLPLLHAYLKAPKGSKVEKQLDEQFKQNLLKGIFGETPPT